LARALHCNSNRKDGPFLSVNCSVTSERLLETDLFGQEQDAVAESARARRGALEEAQGGTLFLKEIEHLPPSLQIRLHRALQDGSIRRMGGSQDISVDVRVIASCVSDLEGEVEAGRFREDLFYRLNVIPIRIPPLRERRADIPPLVDRFVEKYARETGKAVNGVSPEALEEILRYSWKGNVRELENVIERAVVMADGLSIEAAYLSPWLREDGRGGVFGISPDDYSVKKVVRRVEEELIRRALRKTKGNRTEASRLLEISHRTLLYKIKDYRIEG
jgi:two-component system response regulator AtoC